MPGVGSNRINLMGNYEIPERYESALAAGVRFFVLRHPRQPLYFEDEFYGPFDVDASGGGDIMGREVRNIRWRTGSTSSVSFLPQGKSDVGIAFMPDDVYYHNRMLLAVTPWPIVEGIYRPGEGLSGGPQANMEIDCLRQAIYCDMPIIDIIDSAGRKRSFAKTEEEADAYINQKVLKLRGYGGVPYEIQPYLRCKKVPGTMKSLNPEVLAIIEVHGRDEFGWTASEPFKTKILPKVNAMIAKRSGVMAGNAPSLDVRAQILEALPDILASLTPEQKQQLLNTPRPSAAAEAVPEVNLDPEVADADSGIEKTPVEMTEESLGERKKTDLQSIAMNLECSLTMKESKTDLVALILAAQKAKASATELVLN
jgi:hypothetical protein